MPLLLAAASSVSSSAAYLGAPLNTLESQSSQFEAPSLLPTIFSVVTSLAFVVLLIYVVYWALRRFRAGQGISSGREAQGLIHVLEKTYFDAKRGLAVVEMNGEVFFVGLADDVTLLSHIKDPDVVARLKDSAPSPGGLLGFQEQLERVGVHLRREQWKRSKEDLRTQAEALGAQIERIKPSKKKDA